MPDDGTMVITNKKGNFVLCEGVELLSLSPEGPVKELCTGVILDYSPGIDEKYKDYNHILVGPAYMDENSDGVLDITTKEASKRDPVTPNNYEPTRYIIKNNAPIEIGYHIYGIEYDGEIVDGLPFICAAVITPIKDGEFDFENAEMYAKEGLEFKDVESFMQ